MFHSFTVLTREILEEKFRVFSRSCYIPFLFTVDKMVHKRQRSSHLEFFAVSSFEITELGNHWTEQCLFPETN